MDAHARLVRVELLGPEETHIVGGNHRHRAPRSQRHGGGDVVLLGCATEALQLEVIAAREEREPRRQQALRVRLARIAQRAPDVAVGGPGERDQAAAVLRAEPAALDARHAALLALKIGTAHQARKVAVAFRRLAQQCQVHADERLDAALERLAVEFHHREEVVLVGDGDRRHSGGRGGGDEFRDAHDAVGERILRVHAQVDEPR